MQSAKGPEFHLYDGDENCPDNPFMAAMMSLTDDPRI